MRNFLPPFILLMAILAQATTVTAQRSSAMRPSGGTSGGTSGGNTSAVRAASGSASTQNIGSVGTVDASARFVRDNRQTGQFVGATADTGFVGQVAAGSSTGGGQTGVGTGTRGARAANANTGGGNNQGRNQVRAALEVAFAFPTRATDVQAEAIATRITRSKWFDAAPPVHLTIEDGIATLRGSVATSRDRVLIENLVMLEGGVRQVVNELTLVEDDPTARP